MSFLSSYTFFLFIIIKLLFLSKYIHIFCVLQYCQRTEDAHTHLNSTRNMLQRRSNNLERLLLCYYNILIYMFLCFYVYYILCFYVCSINILIYMRFLHSSLASNWKTSIILIPLYLTVPNWN